MSTPISSAWSFVACPVCHAHNAVVHPACAARGRRCHWGAGLAGRVLCGPGLWLWLDWLDKLQRASLLEELLADDVIARALEEAPHRHAYDRTLTARVTVICLLVACMFPGAGYDMALAAAFGLPGLSLKPGTAVPSGPASPRPGACSASGS